MNKKILVGAVAMALAGLAQAQSNVTLYGIADAGILAGAKSPNGKIAQIRSGFQNGSRWGLKGMEDLGDGLKAKFQLESGFNLDDGSSAQGGLLFGRRATVGLQGGFGSVELGRRDGVLVDLLATVEPSGAGNSLGFNDILTNSGIRGYQRRYNNQIRYETPNFSGFGAQAMYSLGESNAANGTTKTLNDDWGFGINYGNGPLYVGYAYNRSKDAASTSTTAPIAISGTASHKYNAFGATYDLQVVKLSGFYFTNKRDAISASALVSAAPKISDRIWSLGALVPFGANSVAAQYSKVKDKSGRSTGAADARQISLTFQHVLSKRTNLYAGYTNIDNKNYLASVGGYAAYSTGLFSSTGKSAGWIGGIRHQF